MKLLKAILLTGMILMLGFGIVVAQDDITTSLKEAVQFLSKKLGRPIPSIDTYSYEIITFADSSLDCPEPGKNYTPGAVTGYKFLITVGGISYDVRISTDGLLTTLCNNTDIKQTSTLATYRNPQFSIPYPNNWRVTVRDTDILFGLGQSMVCSQPGMVVTPMGTINANTTPDSILDDYNQNPNAFGAKFDADRISLGSIGRSVLYVAPCADGSPRQSRISAFVAYGRAYRVWQFAPQNAFSQWSDVYLQAVNGFSPAPDTPASGHPVAPPTQSPLAAIVHIFAGNVYTGTLVDLPGTPITDDAASDHAYSSPVISPKGDRIAFIDPSNAALLIAPSAGGTIRKLADNLAVGYPPAWKSDSSEIAYVAVDSTGNTFTVMAAKADGNGTSKIGSLPPITSADATEPAAGEPSCTGSTSDPAEQLYWSATGVNGNDLVLTWARDGALYFSLNCDGSGIGRLSGSSTAPEVIDGKLHRARLSPDGTQLLGILDTKLVRVQVSDHTVSEIKTTANPDHVAWSPDGKSIYYSTAGAGQALKLDAGSDKARGLKAFGVWPFQSTTYDVTLHNIDLNSGVDTQLFKTTARAIVNIAPSPDGSGVLFTVIQDVSNLIEAFKNNESPGDMRREAPNALLYWQSLPAGSPQLLAVTQGQSWGPLGSAPAPTPTGGPAQKPTLSKTLIVPTVGAPPTNTPGPVRPMVGVPVGATSNK